MQRGFAHLVLILLIILLLVSGIFIYTQFFKNSSNTVSENTNAITDLITANQKPENKEYSNSNLGISFIYPGERFSVAEETEAEYDKRAAGSASNTPNGSFRKNFTRYVQYPPGEQVGSVLVLDETKNYENSPLSLWVFNNPDNLDAESWFDKYWYFPYVWGDFTYSGKKETMPVNTASVSGQLAKSQIVEHSPGKPQFIYVPVNGKMYLLRIPTENEAKLLDKNGKVIDNSEVVDSILESIKFSSN